MKNIVDSCYDNSLNGINPQKVMQPAAEPRVGAGAFSPLSSHLPKQENSAGESFNIPPPLRQPVTLNQAQEAMAHILQAVSPDIDGRSTVTLGAFERAPMETITVEVALFGVKYFGDLSNLKALAETIHLHGVENLRLRQNEDLRKQTDKTIEDHQKAHKAGIFSAVVDWIVSAAEVISGVAKLVIGDYQGGVMDLAAGCAGLVKAMCTTLALTDPDPEHANTYKEIADVAGKVQLAFEIAGMMVDIISVGRGVMAAKSISRASETVMRGTAGQAVKTAVTQGSEVAVKTAAVEVGRQVAEQVSEQVARNITGQATRFMGQGHLLKAFSNQAIENMVTKAVETAAKKAMKSGANTTAEELTEQVVKEVKRAVVHAAVHASIMSARNTAKAITRTSLQGANNVYQGALEIHRAELQKVVQELIVEASYMQFMLDEFEKIKKRSKEDISNLMEGAANSLSAGSESQSSVGVMLSSIAANIA
ncbi:type III secretion system translocon subunit SctE [Salmonella enterica]|nr:type III secretion system translocon protein [Salmonella enterica subsp. enterica serovar Sandiego]EEC0251688.1 YopB/SseC family type III secretion system translocon subunit [Salmonella enterica subsp. enterica]EJW2129029.1 type III secretion system translocon subunit SctE [Salmonella enterica]EEE4266512.1 YopB/SseC family type III secretion system translocon subunit [Salmonella enterica subsp. enterica serovar Sandiego]EKT1704961.1 type III secretion system translocon subunit SctE [Salmonel